MSKKNTRTKELILNNINIENNCWIWKKHLNHCGYGTITHNNKKYLSHRLSYLIFKGKIPKDLYVLHTCDNPPCVNPDHLWTGSQFDNMLDMKQKNRSSKGLIRAGQNNPKSKLKNKDINVIKDLYKNGTKVKEISKMFNVYWTTIYKILNNETWNLK